MAPNSSAWCQWLIFFSLLLRHNGRDGISNHQPYECWLNRPSRRRSKKTSKLRVAGLCAWNSPETGEFPAQMASSAENVSIWWRHHDYIWRLLWLYLQHIEEKEICFVAIVTPRYIGMTKIFYLRFWSKCRSYHIIGITIYEIIFHRSNLYCWNINRTGNPRVSCHIHYCDVIMSVMAYQITGDTIVYSID